MHGLKTPTLIGIGVVVILVVGLFAAFQANRQQQELLSITNFDECVAAGNPVMESYPEQCRTPDGRTFVNEAQSDGLNDAAGGTFPAGECVRAGCSQTLCVEAGEASDIITTCEYRAEYACYQEGICERQSNGKCGWTLTTELQQCLANPPALE